MADSSANLKVKATMDNADLKKKCKDSKDALKSFANVSEDAMDALGDILGVNLNKLQDISNAINGLGIKLQETGNSGVAAFSKLLQKVNATGLAIGGLGLAGALGIFKLLNEEAKAFKNTLEGAKIDVMTTAYVDTYRQVIHSFNKDLGEGFAETESGFKKFWGTLGSNISAYITSGAFIRGAAGASTVVPQPNVDLMNNYINRINEANEAATEAERIAGNIQALQTEIAEKTGEWEAKEAEIVRLRRIASDDTVDIQVRQSAIAEALELTKTLYGEQADIHGQILDYQRQYNALMPPSSENLGEINKRHKEVSDILERQYNTEKELVEQQVTLTAEAEKEAAARKAALAAAREMKRLREELVEWTAGAKSVTPVQGQAFVQAEVGVPDVLDTKIYLEDWWNTVTTDLGKIGKLHIGFDPDNMATIREDMVDLSSEVQQIMTSSFETIGVAIGGLIGDLATGGDAWANFADTAISAFADLAIFVGKTAISTGVATLGIKAALESLNGWVAIAAGVALVALGSAVKTSLSNAASGSYGYTGGGVASASGSYGSSNSGFGTGFEMREMTVNVTGTLRADGNQLLTVIENENKRKNHTT